MMETVGFSESGAFLLELDSSSYKAPQPVYGSALLNYFRTRLHGVISQMTGMLICTELVSADACAYTCKVI